MDKTRSGLYTKLRENGHEMDMHIAHEEGKGGGGGRTVPMPDMVNSLDRWTIDVAPVLAEMGAVPHMR